MKLIVDAAPHEYMLEQIEFNLRMVCKTTFIPVCMHNTITKRGETAMMRATSWGRKANVVELVKAGANPDLQDKV